MHDRQPAWRVPRQIAMQRGSPEETQQLLAGALTLVPCTHTHTPTTTTTTPPDGYVPLANCPAHRQRQGLHQALKSPTLQEAEGGAEEMHQAMHQALQRCLCKVRCGTTTMTTTTVITTTTTTSIGRGMPLPPPPGSNGYVATIGRGMPLPRRLDLESFRNRY